MHGKFIPQYRKLASARTANLLVNVALLKDIYIHAQE